MLTQLLLLLIFVTIKAVAVRVQDCECGLINTSSISNTRVVGGRPTSCREFPWLTLILKSGNVHCGGSLINNRYVLTAGHCVRWVNLGDLSILLGTYQRRGFRGIRRSLNEVIIHHSFTSDKAHDTNDIALLSLNRPVKITGNILPICLPHPMSDYTGRTAIVAGWGITERNNVSRYPQKTYLKIFSSEKCKLSPIGIHFTDTMLCAYMAGTDACQGDSGGPLMYERPSGKAELIGIVSWGDGCAKNNSPGVYTRITNYLNWIADNTKDGVYCKIN